MSDQEREQFGDDPNAELTPVEASEPGSDPGGDTPRPLPTSQAGLAKPDQNDLLLILAAHLGGLVGFPIVAPLVVFLVTKDTKPFVRSHACEALNFQITLMAVSIPLVILGALICITIPVAVAFGIAGVVFAIMAAIKASEGREYRYPMSFRFIN